MSNIEAPGAVIPNMSVENRRREQFELFFLFVSKIALKYMQCV